MENAKAAASINGLDYSDTHQVIKALIEAQLTERAAEIIIGFEQSQNIQLQKNLRESQGNLATRDDLKIDKLSLQKEIEEVRLTLQKEIEEVRLTLQNEIEEVRLTLQKEIEEVRLTLQKEIEEVRLTLQNEIEEVRLTLQKEIVESSKKTIRWLVGSLLAYSGIIVGILKFL